MKKITIIALSISLWGCANNSTNEQAAIATESAPQKEEHHHDEHEAIELNNGEKWTVDAEMMTHIRNMENDVNTLASEGKKDYKSLATKLQTNIELLTSNCTMEGKAHDELHKWLVPFIGMVEEFSETKDEGKAAKQLEEFKISFKTFNQYFQ